MKPESYVGEFFRLIQEEVGDCTDFILFRQKDADSPRINFRYSHASHDGFTAMMDLLRRNDLAALTNIPKFSKVLKPSRWVLIKKFFLKSLKVSFKAQDFKNFNSQADNSSQEIPPSHGSFTLSLDDSKKIDAFCLRERIPPMAFLLYFLDQEVSMLTEGKGDRLWMVPISLRSTIEHSEEHEDPLMTGFLDLVLPVEDPKKLGQSIRQEFKNWSHWVGFYAFSLARFVPLFLMKRLVKLQSKIQVRTGNFSYMGRWGNELHPTTDIIGGYPPVTRNQPVAGIAVHWCGRLTLNFIIHPFISRDEAIALKVVHGWKNRMMSALT